MCPFYRVAIGVWSHSSSTQRVKTVESWFLTGFLIVVLLGVPHNDVEDNHAKDLLIPAIGLSMRVSIIAFAFQVWGCLVAVIVHRYFHVLLSLNTFRSRNVQCWGFSTAVRGLWHTAGLNVHQIPFLLCFAIAFIYLFSVCNLAQLFFHGPISCLSFTFR